MYMISPLVDPQDRYESDDTLYLVMELCSGGDLFGSITRMVRQQQEI